MLRSALISVAVLLLASCGSDDRVAVATSSFPHEESAIAPDPAVRWGVLPNGARYALMQAVQPPGRVSLRLRIASGSLLEADEQRGLAHMLEHMAFNGSKHYPPGSLIPTLQNLGIGFGNHLNAHTGFDETVYKLDLPNTRPETILLGLTVLADQAGGLLLDKDEVERERGVVLAELRDGDGPGMRLRRREIALLTAGTRIGDRLPIGHAETVAAATPQLLRDYYATWYRPERMILSIAGDIDLVAVEAQVRDVLGGAQALTPATGEPALGTLVPGIATAAMYDAEADGTSVRVTGVVQRALPVDSVAAREEQFLRDLGEGILARRIRKLIESDPSCPLLNGGGFSYPWLGLYLVGATGDAKPGRALDALVVLTREYRRLAEHGPTAGELAVELAGIRSGLDAAVAQQGARRNDALAAALYDSVADRRVFTSPEQQRVLGLAMCAAATPALVQQAVSTGWIRRWRTVAVVTGKDDLGADGDQLVRTTFDGAMQSAVTAPVASAVASWAYARPTTWDGALPAANDASPWVLGQANGISMAVMTSTFQPGQVLIRLRLSVRTGPRQPGLDELASRALIDGGLGRHSAAELSEVLAGSTAQFSGIAIEDGAIVLNGACAPQDLRTTLELLRAWIDDAAWRPEAEGRARSAWLSALEAEASEVEVSTWREFSRLCLPDAPWRRKADRDQAAATTLDGVKAWLSPLLGSAPLSCAIVGDIPADEAMRIAAGVLGGGRPVVPVASDPAAVSAALPAQPAMPAGEHRITVPGSVAKAQIIIAWPTVDIYDIHRTRRLGLLGAIFGERLRVEVREKIGDAYSPSAWHFAGEDWGGHGNLTASIGCSSDRIDVVRDATLAIAAGLAAGGVDQDLLDRVRTPMLTSVAERRRQNGWWLGLLARASEQPFRMAWQAGIETDIQAVTPAELNDLAKTYLVPEKALIVIGSSR